MIAKSKRIAANFALAIGALAIALALGEGIVRLLYKDQTVLFPRYHTDYQYGPYVIRGIRSNADFWHTSKDGSWEFITNDRGFRNSKNFPYAKPTRVFRVLSLGDSHTQGYEVRQDQTFSAVLERFLNARGLTAEVLNTGVSGFGTAEELVFLENEGIRYQPDVVILGFYANDFDDNLRSGLFTLDDAGRLKDEKYVYIPGVGIQNFIYAIPPIRWLSENSYFYSIFFNGVWNYFKVERLKHARQDSGAVAPGPENAVATGQATAKDIALAAVLLERMNKFCIDRHIRFVVVDIPARVGAYGFVSSLPPRLTESLVSAGIEVISSETVFAGMNGSVELHVPHGHNHISDTAHALIGVEIGRRLLAPEQGRKR